MENNLPIHLQEILFGTSDKSESKKISSLEKKGIIKKIAPRIYTSNLEEDPATVIKRNWLNILSKQFPGALLSHRSALEFQPTKEGYVFITYSYTKKIKLPGLTIRVLKGPNPIEGDHSIFGNLLVSQEARAFLENLEESRKSGSESKVISLSKVEEKLEMILKIKDEKSLNALRDSAREIAPVLGMEKEFKKLNKIISALLSSHTSNILTSSIAKARVLGEPFDSNRIKLFEGLYNTLAEKIFPDFPDRNTSIKSYNNFAFFDSYFSNYIEGTIFEIEEAKNIIATDMPMPSRDEDSHDMLGTYHIVSNQKEMSNCPKDANEFLKILQYRHKVILSSRLSKNPGQFKDKNNYAGNTAFVDFNLVKGTLKKGFEYYIALRHPFAKAAYMMFLVSEVHPFLDGNGRLARIMMNAELSSKKVSKIIIPTVYREDYILTLKKLTKSNEPEAYIRMLQRAWTFSANIFDEDMNRMEHYLKEADAFKEPAEGKMKIVSR
jgi:hypothetical protein